MIDLYTWSTPNGRKVSIMLEECALPYRVHPINIGKDDQFKPEFVAISPNNMIPAIVDLAAFPQVKRWFDAISARPAVAKGMAVPA